MDWCKASLGGKTKHYGHCSTHSGRGRRRRGGLQDAQETNNWSATDRAKATPNSVMHARFFPPGRLDSRDIGYRFRFCRIWIRWILTDTQHTHLPGWGMMSRTI